MKDSFNTQRLYIRPITTDDAPFILELMNSPKWIQFIGDRNIKSVEDAEAYIKEKALPQITTHGYGNFVVIRKSDNIKLGTCGVYHREGIEIPDIGFAFLPSNEGKGYAFEATSELIELLKDNYGLAKLSAYTLEENLASRKLIERLGLKLKGTGVLPTSDEELLYYYREL
ncbi:GNAT family N-acetyltransferase [Winogradskyella sp.]|uniref:GNAT family N-acetyltransferase n=1 Tax=Winogradskyella sp. TaxID=1883156 RepID=UPI0026113845|nr:GNAT family N-acetyltransferase [uncultured Winogradskyella sp.]